MDTIAGLTLIRRLAEGERSTVWHARARSGALHAVKVFAPQVGPEEIDAELDALAQAQGPHVVPLLDVSADARGATALVLRRLRPLPLASLIAERGPLAVGEAITVLAPLAAAVARLHAGGVAHGRLDARAVLFDEAGAPFLASFGRASVLPEATSPLPEARLALLPEIVSDARALRALARALVPSATTVGWLSGDDVPPERFAAELAERVFELGDATAVAFERSSTAPRPADALRAEASAPSAQAASPVRGWFAAAPLPPVLLDAADAAVATAIGWAGRLRVSWVGGIRPRAWLVLGGAAALLVAAVALPRGDPTVGESSAVGAPHAAAPDPAAPDRTAPERTAPDASAPEAQAQTHGDAVSGDDPVAAAALLLDARHGCLRDLSVLCLDAVHQRGAPIVRADADLVEHLRTGSGTSLPRPGPMQLVERLGDTAILAGDDAAGEPVTVVVSRGADGWRLREVRVGEG